jgi:hypothetical protein
MFYPEFVFQFLSTSPMDVFPPWDIIEHEANARLFLAAYPILIIEVLQK